MLNFEMVIFLPRVKRLLQKKIQKFYSFAALESTVFYRYFCSLREESSIEFKASTDARLVWNDH